MLFEGAVTESWRRVAKILLDCAVSYGQTDGCAKLVEDCRKLLQKIRTIEESDSEREVFERSRCTVSAS